MQSLKVFGGVDRRYTSVRCLVNSQLSKALISERCKALISERWHDWKYEIFTTFMSFMRCYLFWLSFTLGVIYWMLFLLSATNKPFMLTAIMPNVLMLGVVMLNVVAPAQQPYIKNKNIHWNVHLKKILHTSLQSWDNGTLQETLNEGEGLELTS
jgi:hypothetical protein